MRGGGFRVALSLKINRDSLNLVAEGRIGGKCLVRVKISFKAILLPRPKFKLKQGVESVDRHVLLLNISYT